MAGGRTQYNPNAMSAYGPQREDSIGYDPRNPNAQRATQMVKPYTPKATGSPKYTLKDK